MVEVVSAKCVYDRNIEAAGSIPRTTLTLTTGVPERPKSGAEHRGPVRGTGDLNPVRGTGDPRRPRHRLADGMWGGMIYSMFQNCRTSTGTWLPDRIPGQIVRLSCLFFTHAKCFFENPS